MNAWKLIAPKSLEYYSSSSAPVDSPDVVKVKIEMATLTHTDYNNYSLGMKDYPFIMGRQAAGLVSEVFNSPDSFFVKSDKVVIDPVIACNSCIACKTGKPEQCSSKKVLGVNTNGLYTDFITLPIDAVHRIPQSMPFETAVFTEYVAMAVNVMDKINIQKGDHVAILGCNKIGYILAQIVSYYHGIPVVVDSNEKALEEVREVGVSYTLNPEKTDIIDEVFSITGGRMCEKVIFLTNMTLNVDTAIELCAFNGVLCPCGYSAPKGYADFEEICKKQLMIRTVNSGFRCFPAAINLLANKSIVVNNLATDKIKFENLDKTFATLNEEELIYKSKLITI